MSLVLDEFITLHREAIIVGARLRVAARTCPKPSDIELAHGIPVFLEQLVSALRLARATDLIDHAEIGESAGRHGHDLLRRGLTIGQVVHDYGDVCQTITELAVRYGIAIATDEFRTLNLCLDDAIAGAVTEYAHQRECGIAREGTERLGVLAHELRNALNTATLAFASIQSGRVAPGGSTGLVLGRSLLNLRDLVDRSLAQVRLEAGVALHAAFSVAELIEELEIGAFLQAQAKGLHFAAETVARDVMVQGDRAILMAALANLLQNAFKFTRKHTQVGLTVRITSERVVFNVEDECGGLAPGAVETMFQPFVQKDGDRSGLGLGLAICVKAARANAGEVYVRDVPGHGCVFSFDLPRAFPGTNVVAAESHPVLS